jgi:hypothetical protein
LSEMKGIRTQSGRKLVTTKKIANAAVQHCANTIQSRYSMGTRRNAQAPIITRILTTFVAMPLANQTRWG